MILTKDELIHALQNEVRILLHLISKVDPATLDYRLSPKQRSLLELLQYLVFMPEVHMRAALADSFSLDGFQTAWQAGEATAKAMNLAQITEAIGRAARVDRGIVEPLLRRRSSRANRNVREQGQPRVDAGSARAVSLRRLSHAVVPVSEGRRARRAEHLQPLARRGRATMMSRHAQTPASAARHQARDVAQRRSRDRAYSERSISS